MYNRSGSSSYQTPRGAGGLGVRIPGQLNRTQCRRRLATAATFLRARSCVAQALIYGDGPRPLITRFGVILRA